MSKEEFKKSRLRYLTSKNVGALESSGWMLLRDNLPPNSGGDSESPYISEPINMIINNPECEHYSYDDIFVARLFLGWDSTISFHMSSLSCGNTSWDIKDAEILADIYWKEISIPKLEYLGEI